MSEDISWHQLVEWYQYFEVCPFGEERADLRSAMAGCAIANEIRAVAGGLAGKKLDALQPADLMLDTGRKVKKAKSAARNDDRADRARAEAYHRAWAESLKRRQLEAQQQAVTRSKSVKPERKRYQR